MKLKGEYVLTEIGDEVIACSVGEGKPRVVTLNESGKLLWQLLEQGCTEEALSTALCREFEVTADRAMADAHSFVEYLQSRGIL